MNRESRIQQQNRNLIPAALIEAVAAAVRRLLPVADRAAAARTPTDRDSLLAELRQAIVEIVRARGYRYDDDGFELASGKWSHHFVDGKRALAGGDDLGTAAEALVELARTMGVSWDAVGGLTNGADHLAHAVALLTKKHWFFVRKTPKRRGTRQRIEGADVTSSTKVLLVDDVVTTGGSILDALEAITETGARVTGAISLVDRDDVAQSRFDELGIPYAALVTYADLGIPPVREEPDSHAERVG